MLNFSTPYFSVEKLKNHLSVLKALTCLSVVTEQTPRTRRSVTMGKALPHREVLGC